MILIFVVPPRPAIFDAKKAHRSTYGLLQLASSPKRCPKRESDPRYLLSGLCGVPIPPHLRIFSMVSSKTMPPWRYRTSHTTIVWFGKPNLRFPSELDGTDDTFDPEYRM
jgi:hypothetical protein